ncbi:hypothetical protein QBC39DRAFT_345414 [Podospora conica]|nr:hypothetical protein QBC39DRAFT_345414 [Schizothecium conicum]
MMSGPTASTSMVSSAGEAYGQALCALHHELRVAPKTKALPSQIIASIMCLLFAELFQPTSLGSWMAHLHGFGQSMQLAKPGFYASGIPHRLFAGARPILIVLGFIARKTTFLAAEEWKHDPFVETPASPMQKLMSEASVIPTILETLDDLATRPRDLAIITAENCVQQLVDVIGSLERWKATSPSTKVPLFGCTPIGNGDMPNLWFPSITDANEATHFWAFKAVCLATINQVAVSYPEVGFELQSLAAWTTEDSISQETIKLSRWICQSMEYQTQGDMRLYGMSRRLCFRSGWRTMSSPPGARAPQRNLHCAGQS